MSTLILEKRRSDQRASYLDANAGSLFAERERRMMIKRLHERNVKEVNSGTQRIVADAKPAYLTPDGKFNDAAFGFVESEVKRVHLEATVTRMDQGDESCIVVKAVICEGELNAEFSPKGALLVKPNDLERLSEEAMRDLEIDGRLSLFDKIFYELYSIGQPAFD
jgi:hypothetical protein